MSNKKKGTDWEFHFCEILAEHGFWAHRIEPDVRGAQPFDIIASKNDVPFVFDCKTCDDDTFRINRVEENQKMAFDLWRDCGNRNTFFAVKHGTSIHLIPYLMVKLLKKVKLDESNRWAEDTDQGAKRTGLELLPE